MKKTIVAIGVLIPVAVLLLAMVLCDEGAGPGLIEDRLARIDTAIEAEVAAGKIPGAVALVVRNGEVAYHKRFGFADIDAQTPMQLDSIFRIASMTKAVTSVAVMMLSKGSYS